MPQIAALYKELSRVTGSKVVEMNRAVVIAETGQLDQVLELVESLELETYPHFHSTRAELLRRLGRADLSRASSETAIALVSSQLESEFLERRPET